MSHNSKISNLLKTISESVKYAQSQEDLIAALSPAVNFKGKIGYDNSSTWLVILGSALAITLSIIFGMPNGRSMETWAIGVISLSMITSFVFLALTFSRKQKINNLSDKIIRANILFTNRLSELPIDGKDLAESLCKEFAEFNRGNDKKEILSLLEGSHQGDRHTFNFKVYDYHYVIRRTETRSVSDGKGGMRTETRTVYDHYYRHGLMMDFDLYKSLAVMEDKVKISGETFRPASNEFNKKFSVIAQTELIAAKFLKPAVVLAFEDLGKTFTDLNFEINSEGKLCLSFKDDDLVFTKRQSGIENPEEFVKELRERSKPVKLAMLLDFICNILRLSDNNFGEKTYVN